MSFYGGLGPWGNNKRRLVQSRETRHKSTDGGRAVCVYGYVRGEVRRDGGGRREVTRAVLWRDGRRAKKSADVASFRPGGIYFSRDDSIGESSRKPREYSLDSCDFGRD